MLGRLLTVILVTAALVGCRSSGGDDDDDNGADAGADETTIYSIQDGTIGNGEAVTLRGDVVVAIDSYGDSVGSIWIAEPDEHPTYGRAYGGVQVFTTDIGQVTGLAVGDLIDVEGGSVDEFALNCNDADVDCSDTLQTLTEISGTLTITKVGEGPVPDPVVVLPQDMAADPEEAEKWESVLIVLDNVAVTSGLRDVGSDTTLMEMRVTGPFLVQSALADLGDVTRDDCYTSITGLGNYFFNYKLLPRAANDIVKAADTSACLYETQAADCDDGMDNDFDGFFDCVDFSCQNANPVLCTVDGTVVEIQDGTVAENTRVALAGVVVTAVSDDTIDIWVQDAGSSADYNGLHLFRGDGASSITVAVGDLVDVTGNVSEFFDETELVVDPALSDVTVTGAGSVTVRIGLTPSMLSDAVSAEPFEGMLVQIEDAPVVLMNDGFGNFTVGITGETLNIDNEIFGFTLPAKATCFATITGVAAYAFSERKMYPRDANDLVTGGTCL